MACSKTGISHGNGYDDQEKVHINFCSFDELLAIPTVGETTADRIWDFKKRVILRLKF
jgi:DNA uptake protein ComE-like DNA-binding protein